MQKTILPGRDHHFFHSLEPKSADTNSKTMINYEKMQKSNCELNGHPHNRFVIFLWHLLRFFRKKMLSPGDNLHN